MDVRRTLGGTADVAADGAISAYYGEEGRSPAPENASTGGTPHPVNRRRHPPAHPHVLRPPPRGSTATPTPRRSPLPLRRLPTHPAPDRTSLSLRHRPP